MPAFSLVTTEAMLCNVYNKSHMLFDTGNISCPKQSYLFHSKMTFIIIQYKRFQWLVTHLHRLQLALIDWMGYMLKHLDC